MSTAEALLASPTIKAPPEGLGAAGASFWRAVTTALDLEAHERVLLVEVVRTLDVLDALDAVVRAEGALITGKRGPQAHPAAVEARQQRLVLSRLLATLRLPDDFEAPEPTGSPTAAIRRPQRRGAARGPYSTSRDRSGPL